MDTVQSRQQILDVEVGGVRIKDMSAISFYQWVLGKLNNTLTYDPRVQALVSKCNPGLSRNIPDEFKLKIISELRALSDLGVTFP